jgi:serine protease Do
MKTLTIRTHPTIRKAGARVGVPLLALAIIAAGTTGAYALRAETSNAPLAIAVQASLPASFADLVELASPSVVAIRTVNEVNQSGVRAAPRLRPGTPFAEQFKRFFEHHGRGAQKVQGQGSGFVVDADGLIVTNHHVIKGASEILVVLADGRELPATIQGVDERTDLAVLKVKSDTPLVPVVFGDSEAARVGDWVVAVGNPFGLGGTFTAGIISARGRDIQSGPYDDFFQIDAPINRGNSGGALFNVAGEVVGVNTAIFSPNGGNVGIGFAVPSNQAAAVVADLVKSGRVARGWLGVTIQPLNAELAQALGLDVARGALVNAVTEPSPAHAAGLRPGDVIAAIDGKQVTATREVSRRVAAAGAKAELDLTVWRDAQSMKILVQLEELATVARQEQGSGEPTLSNPLLGLTLAPLEDSERAGPGVLIAQVTPGSPAHGIRLAAGMVIRMVGSTPVASVGKLVDLVARAKRAGRTHVALFVDTRDGREGYVTLPVA